ncbi:HNH endonuclease [Nocardia exalbida]|uniref:HNH endonuclease n=1 Tax=Nocardia exalbida TaxID=290231 RepID=UPI0009FE82E7
MEAEPGRKLRPGENVHHINGDKSANRPEHLGVVAPASADRAESARSGRLGERNTRTPRCCRRR